MYKVLLHFVSDCFILFNYSITLIQINSTTTTEIATRTQVTATDITSATTENIRTSLGTTNISATYKARQVKINQTKEK